MLSERVPAPAGRALLPPPAGGSSELEVSLRTAGAGGWLDVVDLGAGRLALVTGDVGGVGGEGGAEAAGQLRAAVRTCARLDLPPEQALAVLDALVLDADVAGATCTYAVYDPAQADLVVARAGAPPPVVRSPAGGAQVVAGEGCPPLGACPSPRAERLPLAPGSVVALATTGLLGGADDGAVLALAAALLGGPDELPALADRVLEQRAAGAPGAALLLARVPVDVAHRSTTATVPVPRDRGRVGGARDRVSALAQGWALVPEVADAAGQLAHELVVNALVHGTGDVELRLRLTRDRLVVLVADGSPLLPRRRPAADDEERGRGLHLVAALSSRWGARTVDGGRAGKVVWAELDLG